MRSFWIATIIVYVCVSTLICGYIGFTIGDGVGKSRWGVLVDKQMAELGYLKTELKRFLPHE